MTCSITDSDAEPVGIFIPVALPGIIAATVFAFTVSWGQFLYPMAYLYTNNQMVLTVGIASPRCVPMCSPGA